jgi:hypothetical protein
LKKLPLPLSGDSEPGTDESEVDVVAKPDIIVD